MGSYGRRRWGGPRRCSRAALQQRAAAAGSVSELEERLAEAMAVADEAHALKEEAEVARDGWPRGWPTAAAA